MDATRQLTLAQLASAELKEQNGDTEKATTILVARLIKDRSLLRTVVADVVRDAVNYRVEVSLRNQRQAIIRNATADAVALAEGAAVFARGIAASLLDMPLANGVPLRTATRDQVVEQAERYESVSADMSRKARFLRLIAQSVPGKKTVGAVISDQRALELWTEATQ